MEYDLKEYKAILLQTMKDFIRLCDQQHLTYTVFAGTLLGAVRHHGLIPWDDDIDVAMPRPDYEKLMSLRDHLPLPSYELLDFHTPGYHLPFAKFAHTGSTIWEERGKECIFGVFVDIFPLDETGDDYKATARLHREAKHTAYLYDCSMRKHYWGEVSRFASRGDIRELKNLLLDLCWRRFCKTHYLQKYERIIEETKKARGENLVEINCMYPLKTQIFPKAWYASVRPVPFEDFEVNIPVGYDNILRQVYGDYRQLPPVEKRVTRHYHYFVDLKHRIGIDEIKRLRLSEK